VTLAEFHSRPRAVDWRVLAADRVAPLLAEEADRWARLLDWDCAAEWSAIEHARQAGIAPGIAILDENGAVAGWSHYQTRHHVLQISAFVAQSAPIAHLMLAQILSVPALAQAHSVSFFALTDAPGLASALRQHGLSVERYFYMARDLTRISPPALPDLRRWRTEDLPATADLLARSYEPRSETRPFAPAGTPSEWTDYAFRLTQGGGCGTLEPDASLCLPAGPNRLMAMAIVTRISERAAHLTQLVVDPQMRGRKVGVQLMELACAAAARAGARRMTLFVNAANRRARSLYEAARFQTMGSFVAAGTLQPRRSTSAAPPAGAVITRR
jgi:ribosomal protein S18 acetylase RimI-like enzyme